MSGAKLRALSATATMRCCAMAAAESGSLPEPLLRRHVEAGRLVVKETETPPRRNPLHYAWRTAGNAPPGLALQWWLSQLRSEATRRALLERHAGLVL